MNSLTKAIKTYAHKLGFDLVGVAPAQETRTAEFYADWLARGFAGEMNYLHRHLEKKMDPRHVLPSARSILSVGMNYFTSNIPPEKQRDSSIGIISRYAWGADYHDVIQHKLNCLLKFIQSESKHDVHGKIYVDTGPILEREISHNAGIGFFGKNTNIIHRQLGSWFFIGEILLDIKLDYNETPPKGRCGTCTRCIDACPTGALVAPYTLDARRCIAYLTIELKGSIPKTLRPLMGNRIFGCDVCQEVCPWNDFFFRKCAKPSRESGTASAKKNKNGRARPTQERNYQQRQDVIAPSLLSLMKLSDSEFRERFAGSPIQRAKRRGLLRNVAIALGNWGHPDAINALVQALHDSEPLIRGHAAWALGEISDKFAKQWFRYAFGYSTRRRESGRAKNSLKSLLKREKDPEVITEIREALSDT